MQHLFFCGLQVEWHEDLKKVLKMAGEANKRVVFLFADTQIKSESFVEDISNLLNTYEVPNLLQPADLATTFENIRPRAKAAGLDGNKDQLYTFFLQEVPLLPFLSLAVVQSAAVPGVPALWRLLTNQHYCDTYEPCQYAGADLPVPFCWQHLASCHLYGASCWCHLVCVMLVSTVQHSVQSKRAMHEHRHSAASSPACHAQEEQGLVVEMACSSLICQIAKARDELAVVYACR